MRWLRHAVVCVRRHECGGEQHGVVEPHVVQEAAAQASRVEAFRLAGGGVAELACEHGDRAMVVEELCVRVPEISRR